MRIAWITPYLPTPENTGGRIRIAGLARSLADHELHLYSWVAADDDPSLADGPVYPWRQIRTWRRPIAPFAAFSKLPGRVCRYAGDLYPTVRREHDKRPYDAMIIEHCYGARGFEPLPGCVSILNEHNIESKFFERLLQVEPLQNLHNLREVYTWRQWETSRWRAVDHVTVVTEADADSVSSVRDAHLFPNGIDIDNYTFRAPSTRKGNGVLFTGLMSYKPNVDAALVLAREIEKVRREVPDATLTLAGRDPPRKVRDLACDYIFVTGTLPNIATVFDEQAVYAMPITAGAGSSLKVLEPLASGLPLVAYPFAVRGYPLEANLDFQLVERPGDLARAIVRVLRGRATLDESAERGRRLAERYSWRVIGNRFRSFVEACVASREALAELEA